MISPNVSSPNSIGVAGKGLGAAGKGLGAAGKGVGRDGQGVVQDISIVAGAFYVDLRPAPGPIAECAGPTAMLKSKRGTASSGTSRITSSARPVVNGKMMKSEPVR